MSLVQDFALQADKRDQLVLGISILLKWTRRVTHYRTGVDVDGRPYLVLMWHEGDSRKGTPLMAPMDNAESIADQILAWLNSQEYGQEPDHDGSNHRGFKLSNRSPVISKKPNQYHKPDQEWSSFWSKEYDSSSYDFVYVTPCWIEYHK